MSSFLNCSDWKFKLKRKPPLAFANTSACWEILFIVSKPLLFRQKSGIASLVLIILKTLSSNNGLFCLAVNNLESLWMQFGFSRILRYTLMPAIFIQNFQIRKRVWDFNTTRCVIAEILLTVTFLSSNVYCLSLAICYSYLITSMLFMILIFLTSLLAIVQFLPINPSSVQELVTPAISNALFLTNESLKVEVNNVWKQYLWL